MGDFVIRNLRKLLVGAALCASLAAASGAQASVLFSDNFDAENGGASALNYTGFAKWTVSGQVDLVKQPDYGITCQGGSGSCVDLDGTSGPGSITSQAINFSAGDHLVVSFDLSGSQRSSASDEFNLTGNFGGSTDVLNFANLGGFIGIGSGDYFGATTLGTYEEFIAGDKPWTHYSFGFTAGQAGSLTLIFGTTSDDNIGPLVDNVSVTNGAVPEPAAWALMIGGFGLAGAALRRRRSAVAAA